MRALSAHVLVTGHPTLEEAQRVGEEAKTLIGRRFAIGHATLELECEACHDDLADPCVIESSNHADHDHH